MIQKTVQCTAIFEYFKFLFNLQKNKSIRNNEYDYLCIINFNLRGFQNYDSLTSISRELVMLLKTILRKGDAFYFLERIARYL